MFAAGIALLAPPVVAGGPTRTAIATDAFTGTAGNAVTNFLNLSPSFAIAKYKTGGTTFEVPYGAMNDSRWSGAGSFTDDQYAKVAVLVGAANAGGDRIGVIARASTDTDAGRDGYRAYYANDATRTLVLEKVVNGTVTGLGTNTSHTWVDNDTVEIECLGTSIKALINGTAFISVTDSSLTTGKPGVGGMQGGATAAGDNFEGGNLS